MSDLVAQLVEELEYLIELSDLAMRLANNAGAEYDRDEMLAAPRSALSAAKDGGWQPIETAPKDGRLILVSFGAKGVRAVSWDTPFDDVADEDTGLWCVDDDKHGPYPLRGYSYNSPTAPTAWQPLPNPPKGEV